MEKTLWEFAKRRAKKLHISGGVSAYLAHLIRQDVGVYNLPVAPSKAVPSQAETHKPKKRAAS